LFLRFLAHHKRSAITYYRVELPARTIAKLGLARTEFKLWLDMGANTLERYRALMNSNGLLCYTTFGPDFLRLLKKLKRFPPEKHSEEVIAYAPCVFNDSDDNTHFVNPTNPAFSRLGTRIINMKGEVEILKPGEPVMMVNEQGDKFPLWQDGKDGFDIARNLDRISYLDKCYELSNGLSFTSPRLRDYWASVLKNKNMYVFPNSVCFEDYPEIRTLKDKGVVRVLWQGGDSHYGDWYSLRDVLSPVSKKFPEVRWVIWGSVYPFIHKEIPSNQMIAEEWIHYDAYRLRLATLNFDFAVAPLVNNMFNLGKSAIKFYEAAALPEPRPILAARVPPYSDEIIDGETGMLYSDNDEFKLKFETLVRDAKLRKKLGKAAKEWVGEHRQINKTVVPYFEWIAETISTTQAKRRKFAVPSPLMPRLDLEIRKGKLKKWAEGGLIGDPHGGI